MLPPEGAPADGLASMEALDFLATYAQETGEDPIEALLENPDAERLQEMGTREGEEPPGTDLDRKIKLSESQLTQFAGELCDLLDRHDDAMADHWAREQEIRDHYAMVADTSRGGTTADSSHMSSEFTMMSVDQSAARITTNMQSVKPLAVVDPIIGPYLDPDEAEEIARDAQEFLEEYSNREIGFDQLLPLALHRTTKVGTSVQYITWEHETVKTYVYTRDSGKPQKKERKVGRVRSRLIDNRHVKCWPPTIDNWQRDYTFVGHETFHDRSSWRQITAKYKLSDDEIKQIESDPGEEDVAAESEARRHGVDASAMQDQKLLSPMVKITELWCHMTLPGQTEPDRFQVFLHRPRRKILYLAYNPLHHQGHPYLPIRYKKIDGFAWGLGVGHECHLAHAADEAFRNVELDSLYAGCYWIYLRKIGSGYSSTYDQPRPGMVMYVDDVNEDFKSVKLGGETPELQVAKADNQFRMQQATGISSVMSGQGDPTMKSGAGTGSTLALIEQGNKKLALIDSNIRSDVSAILLHVMQLVAQYATDGLFYRYAPKDAADRIRQARYTPPRGEIGEIFQLRVQAPSASKSDEARQQAYMLIWGFALQHAQTISQYVLQILQQENPAAIPRWLESVARYLNAIATRAIEHSEMPGIERVIPQIPELTPQDQLNNDLSMQLQEAQAQLAQMAQEGAAIAGAPPGGEAQGGGGGPQGIVGGGDVLAA